jgi:hypothetical protein
MSFLNAFLAGFAALAAIPIIIHLLNQRRFKIVTWAAMEFLLATIEKNSRRLQLRDLILMALRAMAIVLLAISLARPTIAPGGLSLIGQQGETAAVVLLDNSLSMGYQVGNDTRFALAKRKAREIIEHLPPGAGVALVLLSDVAVDDIPEPSHDIAFAVSEVGKAPLSDGGTDIANGIARAWKILKSAAAVSKEIYLITDNQANGWPAADNAAWSKLSDEIQGAKPALKLFVTNVGDGATDNVSVDSLVAEDEQVTTESDVGFVATLHNHGTTPAHGVSVELQVGDGKGGPMRTVASQVIDSLDGVQQVRLETRFSEGGDHRVAVTTGLDHLPADNSRYLALEVIDRIRVLIVDGSPAEAGQSFGGESDFLRAALSPRDLDAEEHKALIDTEVTTINGLADKALREYSAVILANLGELPPGLVEGLKTYVKAEGHGLIIFLGDNVQPGRYNQLLYEQAGLLPGRLGERLIEAEEDPAAGKEHGFGFATSDLSHPVVSFFADKETQPFLAQPRFRKAFAIEIAAADLAPAHAAAKAAGAPAAPGNVKEAAKDAAAEAARDPGKDAGKDAGKAGGGCSVVARFVTGQPALAERIAGRGKVLLFASGASRAWGDFPLRPAFLMLTRRMVAEVAHGHQPDKTITVHDRIVETLGAKEAGATVTVRDPRGGSSQITALLTQAGDLAKVEDSETHFAGFYQLSRPGAPETRFYAVNPPRAESELDALDEASLRARFPRLDFQWLDGHAALTTLIDQKRSGREIWPLLFLLCCLCLITESYLALRWAPRGA